MRNSRILLFSSVSLFPLLFLLNCTSNNSTDLGGGLIRDKYPNQYHTYAMSNAEVYGSVTLPELPTDIGFGIHQVAGFPVMTRSKMVVGDSAGEHAGGFARFMLPPDTFASRAFDAAGDTLKSVSIVFSRDSVHTAMPMEIWKAGSALHALQPSASAGDSLLGTVTLHAKDTIDTLFLQLPTQPVNPFAQSIFWACTTATKDRTHLRDTLGLAFAATGALVRIHSDPRLLIGFKKPNDTAHYYISYGINGNRGRDSSKTYYVAQRSVSATDNLPLSYASKRTLVYKFSTRGLWDTLANFQDWDRSQVVSAYFSLQRPDAVHGDTLLIQYLLSDKLVRNGITLDTMFAKNPDPGLIILIDTATKQVGVGSSLQSIKHNVVMEIKPGGDTLYHPDTVYLYLRLGEDAKQVWKKASFTLAPLLKATIAEH